MQIEGRTAGSGLVQIFTLDADGNTIVSTASAKYQQAVLAGNVFTTGSQAARTWSVALNTTHTGLVLSNPINSGKNLIILKASFVLSAAPAAPATIGLFTGFSSAGIVTHTTPATITNCLVGGGGGLALSDEAATLVGTPTWALQMMGGFTAGAFPSTSQAIIDVDGAITVKPGGYVGIGALTAVVGFGTIMYQEK